MFKVAVIGAGVMGSGIAAHIANAGYEVLLFDIVLPDKEDKNFLANQAIEKLKKSRIFASIKSQSLVRAVNLESDLSLLAECDWIIEAISEKIDLKQELYKKIAQYRKPSSIISSNTSTIRLSDLIKEMPEDFRQKFYIVHFFNPPRHMKLLELVTHSENTITDIDFLKDFCFKQLGKQVVLCYDTPGFIANRIGCYWLEVSMREAEKLKLSPSLVDQSLAKYLGIPKTGIFGLYDLIGLDVMQLISASLAASLTTRDAYSLIVETYPDFYSKLVKENYIGRKGKGGFYRLIDKKKQEFNLETKDFEDVKVHNFPQLASLKAMFDQADPIYKFISVTFLKLFHYSLSQAVLIVQDIYSIDQAMKTGYNWKFGPFELMDQLGKEFLKEQFIKNEMSIPPLLEENDLPFYQDREYLQFSGNYAKIPNNETILLSDFKEKRHPIYSSGSCALWDIGDKVVCLELTSKMNSLNEDIFEAIIRVVDYINDTGRKLIIGSDKDIFSAGADLSYFLKAIEAGDFETIENFISLGQKAYNYIQQSEEKVVSAVSGYALGGGCELLLHSHQVAAHIESYIGLVEPNIGLIPGWGGCKQMICKNPPSLRSEIIRNIFVGKISNSAKEAVEMHILNKSDMIVMNRDLLLLEAKKLALQTKISLHSYPAKKDLDISMLSSLAKDENHLLVLEKLAKIFSLSYEDPCDINELEKKSFLELIKTSETRKKVSDFVKK